MILETQCGQHLCSRVEDKIGISVTVYLYKMPKMTMTKASKGNAKLLPVKITTMDAELEFKIEVWMSKYATVTECSVYDYLT